MRFATRSFLGVVLFVSAGGLMCGSDVGEDLAGGGAGGDGGVNVGPGTGPGGCGTKCIPFEVGAGTSSPFNLATHENAGVMIDPTGALVLDPASTGIPDIIWIANTGQGTVTKVDTKTYKVLGRYAIGAGTGGVTLDPSRTSVNSDGDVFLGNRAGGRLLKISSAGTKCPDTNKDGKITTSSGLNDVLPWGQDDCVLWEVPVPDETLVRGVAAQDRETATPVPDDPFRTNVEHYVWAGGTTGRTIRKFDGATGALLISTAAPTKIYGLALDGAGQLYMSGHTDDAASFGRVDTNKCKDQATCDAAEICVSTCDATGACTCTSCASSTCENATKERILVPDAVYGITVDYKQRVWLGGDGVKRYDPKSPATARYAKVTNDFMHGIAADAKGWIWAAGGAMVRRVNAETLAWLDVPGVSSKGMAVDRDGKIWSISLSEGANVIVPGPAIGDNAVQVPAGANPELGGSDPPTALGFCYTYSDMTGQQLALASGKPGYYRQIMDGCSSGDTSWFDLTWTANTTPPNTRVSFYGRTAATKEALKAAPWLFLASQPPNSSPVSLAKVFGATPLQSFLELEVRLQGTFVNNVLVSPSVSKFGVTMTCVEKAK